jgi:uncharacterized protein (TIGR00251 family)
LAGARRDGDDYILNVRVMPRASRNDVSETGDGRLRVRTTAVPADGKANRAVTRLLAGHLGVAPSRLELIRGHGQRDKQFRVRGPL